MRHRTDDGLIFEGAFTNLVVVQRLAEVVGSDQNLVSAMIRTAVQGLAVSGFWAGLAQRKWSEPQLREFQRLSQPLDLVADVAGAMRKGERNAVNPDFGRKLFAWLDQPAA